MTIEQAWASLEVSFLQMRPGCCIVVSPHALAIVLADRDERQKQGEEDEQPKVSS